MDRPASRAHGPAAPEPSRHGGRGDRRARRHGRVRARRGTDSRVWRPAGPAGWLRAAGVVIIGPGEMKSLGSVDTGFRRALGGSSRRMVLARRTFRRRVLNPMVAVRTDGPGVSTRSYTLRTARGRQARCFAWARPSVCRREEPPRGLQLRFRDRVPSLRFGCFSGPENSDFSGIWPKVRHLACKTDNRPGL